MNKITCIGLTSEGPGSQALMVMTAINFAGLCGLTYVHTPFAEIVHPDRAMQDWVTAWEEHFNLGAGELASDGDNSQLVNFAFNFVDLSELFGVDRDDVIKAFHVTIPEFRRKYYANKNRCRSDVLTVWVQVRRGEITPTEHPHMWTSTSFIAETITLVKAVLDRRRIRYRVCVFAQATYADIAELDGPGTEIFLNGDPIWSMREAIEADILIMAKSSFSYVSALLSEGIKICEEGPYPPLGNWVMRGAGGKFDRAAFERQLDELLESRKVQMVDPRRLP